MWHVKWHIMLCAVKDALGMLDSAAGAHAQAPVEGRQALRAVQPHVQCKVLPVLDRRCFVGDVQGVCGNLVPESRKPAKGHSLFGTPGAYLELWEQRWD
jgi:hypothetical protein